MMAITRGLAVGVVLAGAAVGLAVPASAEPLSGSYTETVIDGGMEGVTKMFVATACGPDCAHLVWNVPGVVGDLHSHGDTWTGTHNTRQPDVTCTVTINMKSLVDNEECGPFGNTRWRVAKTG
jgi:hypothetical protein